MFIRFLLSTLVLYSASAFSAEISDLSWLEGKWVNDTLEEQYTSSSGGMILGTSKVVGAKGVVEFFEFVKIEKVQDQIVMSPFPMGKPGVQFTATEITRRTLKFENLANDFPKHINYTLEPTPQGPVLTLEIIGVENGQPAALKFVLKKK